MEARNMPEALALVNTTNEELCKAYTEILKFRQTGLLDSNNTLEIIGRQIAAAQQVDDTHIWQRHIISVTEDCILMEMARRFYNANSPEEYTSMAHNDAIYYLDRETGEIEPGRLFSMHMKDGKIDTVAVNFDKDFDEFDGDKLGKCLFRSREAAQEAWQNRSE